MTTAPAVAFDPFTVTDVLVDKTAKNAVIAREEAMVEAQRLALQKLAERNLTPEELKAFTLPDDKTIASVVQDFEIKGEQLSFTRYAANFTVRFGENVRGFVDVKARSTVAVEAPQSKFVLILPYLETPAGKTLLWEEPNPWRRAWQNGVGNVDTGGRQFLVPLGDIGDVTAGSSDAVWSGDYVPVEKLRTIYNADEVVLAVASKQGPLLAIDVYSWKAGGLEKRERLSPIVNDALPEDEAYKTGAAEVLKFLQKKTMLAPASEPAPTPTIAIIQSDIVSEPLPETVIVDGSTPPPLVEEKKVLPLASASAPAVVPSMPSGPAMEIEGAMTFTDFSRWMEMQKRLARMTPPVKVDIRSISKDGASFTMRFQGSLDILRRVLADNGILLGPDAPYEVKLAQ